MCDKAAVPSSIFALKQQNAAFIFTPPIELFGIMCYNIFVCRKISGDYQFHRKKCDIMTKITIFSGFLGAGKTTLIKKLIKDGYQGEKLVLIENEFGQIGIDGGFLKEAGIQINEMNSGCICCSLVGDFGKALRQVLEDYHPDRILIEPSGVGKLSDVISAVQNLHMQDVELDGFTTVVDAKKCKMYQKNFGEFFNNQITYASCLILSHTAGLTESQLHDAVQRLRELNPAAPIVTTEWDELTGAQLIASMTQKNTLDDELKALLEEETHHHHHHHHDDDDEHEHHHHDHGPDCTCGCHDHDHEHHHHHADEVFTSWGIETPNTYTAEAITAALEALSDAETFGMVLRAKGIVRGENGQWIHFDYVPGTPDVRTGTAEPTGRLCVIGSKLNEAAIAKLFCAE